MKYFFVVVMGMTATYGMDLKKRAMGEKYWIDHLNKTVNCAGTPFKNRMPEKNQLILVQEGDQFRIGTVEEIHSYWNGVNMFLVAIKRHLNDNTFWFMESSLYQLPEDEVIILKKGPQSSSF